MTDLAATAHALFAQGKGILAADESVHTTTVRLASYGIAAGTETRRQFRDLLLGAEGIERYLSGVILFEETLGQKGNDGTLFPDSLARRLIAPGVKVDLGTEPFSESPHELITNGLLGLSERLEQYRRQGAVFAKWRAVFRIDGDALPSGQAIHENAKRLASYAKDAQAAGLVPIVETDVLWEGAHSRRRARAVIANALGTLFSVCEERAVDRRALILKTAMALSGRDGGGQDMPEEVAEDTLAVLLENVPKDVAGVVFLSGGQSPEQATDNLAAIVKRGREQKAPWPLTFSYARALQNEALTLWRGKEENVVVARAAYLSRLAKVSRAVTV